jgi:hypothetical protein
MMKIALEIMPLSSIVSQPSGKKNTPTTIGIIATRNHVSMMGILNGIDSVQLKFKRDINKADGKPVNIW